MEQRADPADGPEIIDVEYLRDGENSLQARIHRPQGSGPFPTALFLHGGAWTLNDRTTQPDIAVAVAERGVVVASIDFRQGGEHPFPSSLIDINYATRWLKIHARDFNGRTDAIGGIGTSSGGHLIVLSAMRARDPRYTTRPFREAPGVDASLAWVVSCTGVLDPHDRYLMAREQNNEWMVATHDAYFLTPDAMSDASPALILKRGEPIDLPPALVVSAAADEWARKGMASEFTSLYRAAGGYAELTESEGMPHSVWRWPESEFKGAIERISAFISRQVVPAAVR